MICNIKNAAQTTHMDGAANANILGLRTANSITFR